MVRMSQKLRLLWVCFEQTRGFSTGWRNWHLSPYLQQPVLSKFRQTFVLYFLETCCLSRSSPLPWAKVQWSLKGHSIPRVQYRHFWINLQRYFCFIFDLEASRSKLLLAIAIGSCGIILVENRVNNFLEFKLAIDVVSVHSRQFLTIFYNSGLQLLFKCSQFWSISIGQWTYQPTCGCLICVMILCWNCKMGVLSIRWLLTNKSFMAIRLIWLVQRTLIHLSYGNYVICTIALQADSASPIFPVIFKIQHYVMTNHVNMLISHCWYSNCQWMSCISHDKQHNDSQS